MLGGAAASAATVPTTQECAARRQPAARLQHDQQRMIQPRVIVSALAAGGV